MLDNGEHKEVYKLRDRGKGFANFSSVHPTYQRDYYIIKPIENAVYYFYE